MPYTLGGLVLPKPKNFVRELVEQSVEHLLMFGKTTKKTQSRKERFILQYVYLTQAQINSILSQYELDTVLQFTVDEGNLSILQTDVLMDVSGLDFPASGKLWLENAKIILTEVQ